MVFDGELHLGPPLILPYTSGVISASITELQVAQRWQLLHHLTPPVLGILENQVVSNFVNFPGITVLSGRQN